LSEFDQPRHRSGISCLLLPLLALLLLLLLLPCMQASLAPHQPAPLHHPQHLKSADIAFHIKFILDTVM
jgi:hypothetical protein